MPSAPTSPRPRRSSSRGTRSSGDRADCFAAEIERTLRPGGVAVLHVAVHRRGDKYSANDLLDVQGLVGLFRGCDVVRVSKVDAFGLDTEVILRKKRSAAARHP